MSRVDPMAPRRPTPTDLRRGVGGSRLDRLRAWWGRDWDRPRPSGAEQRADIGLGVLAAVVAILVVELYRSWLGADLGWRGVEAYGWFALAGLVLGGRRRMPLTTMLIESAVFIVIGERLLMLGSTFPIQMILFTALYSAWAWSRRPRALKVTTVVVVVTMFGWLLWSLLQPGALSHVDRGGLLPPAASALAYSLLINVVYFFGAIGWGHTAWRGARERSIADEGTRLELELAEQLRDRTIAEERVRIARDLHDVVAHHISSIGVQAAGAQRALARDPEAAAAALGTIAGSSREAVTQMHALVHLLRDPTPGSGDPRRAPQPGLGDLPGLATPAGAESMRGPVVEYDVVGEAFAVPDTVAQSLFRIAQEAVTNVRRHADASRASVVLRYVADPRSVEVEVLDDGRGTGGPESAGRPSGGGTGDSGAGSGAGGAGVGGGGGGGGGGNEGFGLRGICERAALHGGEVELGDRPHHGFRVRVRVPVLSSAPSVGAGPGEPGRPGETADAAGSVGAAAGSA